MSIEKPSHNEIEQDEFSFERQFARKESYKVAGGTAEVVDISPRDAKNEVPVFLAPAWACSTEVYKGAMQTLVDSQRRVVTLNHPRVGGSLDKTTYEEELKRYPKEELRKALNILSVMEQKEIEKTDVIAHSEGAVNVVIAAAMHPEKFRNIVLFAPGGLIGKDTFGRLLKGFAGQSKRAGSLNAIPEGPSGEPGLPEIPITDAEKQVGKKAAAEALKYFGKNPVRAVKEGLDLSKSQIHEMLRFLHQKGVGIVVMSGVDDPVFPMEKMQEIAKADMLDGYLALRGGHGALGEHPERYIVAADEMLTKLEAKQAGGVA